MADEEIAAAVAFDPNLRKYSVLTDSDVLRGVEKGSMLEMDGSQLTVVEVCKTLGEAESMCSSRSSDLRNADLQYVHEEPLFRACKDEPSTDDDYDNQTPVSSLENTNGFFAGEPNDDEEEREGMENLQDMLENMLDAFAEDVERINMRYAEVKNFLVKYFGTRNDGAIINDFENHERFVLRSNCCRSLFIRRPRENGPKSFIDRVIEESRLEMEKLRREKEEALLVIQQSSKATRRSVRTAAQQHLQQQHQTTSNEPAKPFTHQFITRAEEEQIFRTCGNVASTYAQRLAKLIFANSLHLYFKDQEPRRREWLHEAVDYRFPSEDKNAHMLKWKNCSNAINKNMRDTQKEKKQESSKTTKELTYTYVSQEREEECFENANGDPIKYGELLAFYCFEDTLEKFFKEQDVKKKEWLRDCLDRRYPIRDREKSDHRWKICAAACNRNRTKVVGADGREDPFPYFPQKIEEECFQKCCGSAPVYAELMSKHLFPDTQHLMFKDQDLGRRNWLHDVLDKRFPTSDKFAHIAKWKTCTAAMNKKLTEPVSSTPVAVSTSSRKDVAKQRRSEVVEESPASVEPEAKRPRRSINISARMAEAKASADSSVENTPLNGRRRSIHKKEPSLSKVEPYTRYPFVTQEEEMDIYENCNSNTQTYAKMLGKVLFAESLKLYYKDQDSDRRQWMREIVDFRFPTPNPAEQKQKWKNVCAAINKNMPSSK